MNPTQVSPKDKQLQFEDSTRNLSASRFSTLLFIHAYQSSLPERERNLFKWTCCAIKWIQSFLMPSDFMLQISIHKVFGAEMICAVYGTTLFMKKALWISPIFIDFWILVAGHREHFVGFEGRKLIKIDHKWSQSCIKLITTSVSQMNTKLPSLGFGFFPTNLL